MSSTRILLLTHAPLAHALRECALHVFADCAADLLAFDVQADAAPGDTLAAARMALERDGARPTLIMTDVLGATPCNVAQELLAGLDARLVSGVNLPMLLRSLCYRQETLDTLVERALQGATQGIMQVASPAPLQSAAKQT